MKKRIRQAAIRIALLREEYSDKEWEQAVRYLEENDVQNRLTRFILDGEMPEKAPKQPRTSKEEKTGVPALPSKQLLAIKDSDTERFTLLSEFEQKLRAKKVLPSLTDIGKFALSLSKGFSPGKSRREAVSSLIREMLSLPMEKLKLVLKAANERSAAGDHDFRDLANFIIHGNRSAPREGPGQSG